MSNDPTRSAFDRIKAILTEIGTLRDDLAELKIELTEAKADRMPPETFGDLVALARLAVMDASARAKKDTAAKRRADLADQMELGL